MKKLIAIILLFSSTANAALTWTQMTLPVELGVTRQQIVFKGVHYVASMVQTPVSTRLWRFDGEQFTRTSYPAGFYVQKMVVFNEELYIFSSVPGGPTHLAAIHKTSDGTNWTSVALPGNSNQMSIYEAEVVGGSIYTVVNSNNAALQGIWRSVGTSSLSWTKIPNFVWDASMFGWHIASAQNDIFVIAVGLKIALNDRRNTFYVSQNGVDWSIVNQGPNMTVPLYTNYIAHQNSLFFTEDGSLLELRKENGVYHLYTHQTYIRCTTFFDDLYAYKAYTSMGIISGRWDKLNQNHEFEPTTMDVNAPWNYDASTAHFRDMVYQAIGNFYWLKKGAMAVRDLGPDFSKTILSGQPGEEVLSFKVDINVRETMNGLTIKNTGTAEAGQDIHKLKLYQQVIGATNFLTELISTDAKTWTTPPGFSAPLSDGLPVVVLADIADTAREGRTIEFSIPVGGIIWKESQSYVIPPNTKVLTTLTITPNPNALAPASVYDTVSDALVYPQPARDLVIFTYNLPSVSDVEIRIYDRLGNLVKELRESSVVAQNGAKTAWDASSVAPGLYFAQFTLTAADGQKRQFKKRVYIDK